MGKKIRIRIRDEFGSYFRELGNNFLGLNYFNSLMRIRDSGSWMEKNSDLGSGMEKICIRDKYSGSVTLVFRINMDSH
jgi:hypothetical protein